MMDKGKTASKGKVVKGQRQKPNRKTRREFGSWLAKVEETVTKRLDELDKLIQLLARSNQTIWTNQKELTKSEELLDEQFAVSTRMTIMSVNSILERLGTAERITEKDIEKLFKDWAEFKKRSDYRNYMMEWFLGVALDKLPPPQEQAKEGDSHVESSSGNERTAEGQSEDCKSSQADDVPKVQEENSAQAQP